MIIAMQQVKVKIARFHIFLLCAMLACFCESNALYGSYLRCFLLVFALLSILFEFMQLNSSECKGIENKTKSTQ